MRNYCESTYTRGIAKILKASSVVDRGIWILAVAISTGVLVLHSTYLFSGFLQHKFTTLTKDKPYITSADRPVRIHANKFCPAPQCWQEALQ